MRHRERDKLRVAQPSHDSEAQDGPDRQVDSSSQTARHAGYNWVVGSHSHDRRSTGECADSSGNTAQSQTNCQIAGAIAIDAQPDATPGGDGSVPGSQCCGARAGIDNRDGSPVVHLRGRR